MSTESSIENGREHYSGFWPLALLGIAFVLLLSYQLIDVFIQRDNLNQQFKQQIDLVTRSIQTQNALQRLAGELLTLADTDPDAKAITNKYKIARNAPPSAPDAPASAATPAK
jgi:hypothetical protein